jgi:hypothetical protein
MARLHHQRPRPGEHRPAVTLAASSAVGLDLLRGDLYRLLDELARAGADRHAELVEQFERAWVDFRDATGRR